MTKLFITPSEAYQHAYQNGVACFPSNWYITENFTWREAFVNENKSDGYPMYEVFENIFELAKILQIARSKMERPFNIHCWVRQIPHNKRAGSTARKSAHINGRAVDFDVTGLSCMQVRNKLLGYKLPIRIEDKTPTWVHIDISSYVDDFKPGLF